MVSETQQRRIVDGSIRGVVGAISMPATLNYLGSEAVQQLLGYADRCRWVPNNDALIDISSLGPDLIPVSVALPGSSFRVDVGSGESLFTTRQLESAAAWSDAAIERSPDMLINDLPPSKNMLKWIAAGLSTTEVQNATTFSFSSGLNGPTAGVRSSVVPVSNLGSGIIDGVAKITARPALMFPCSKPGERIQPDVFAHELCHARQKETNPIVLFRSQGEILDSSVSNELEGYHVGAGVRRAVSNLDDIRLKRLISQGGVESLRQKYFQVFIDTIREERADVNHPYRVSAALIRAYGSYGVDTSGLLMSGYFDLRAAMDYFRQQSNPT